MAFRGAFRRFRGSFVEASWPFVGLSWKLRGALSVNFRPGKVPKRDKREGFSFFVVWARFFSFSFPSTVFLNGLAESFLIVT